MEEYSTPSGKQRGYHLLKAFPTQQLAWWGKKRASGWCKGVDGSWLRQPVHPSPKQGCSEPHAGQGTEAGAGSQPCHSSWQIPTLPPGLCPRQGHQAPMELERDHAQSAWLLQFSCRFLQPHLLALP